MYDLHLHSTFSDGRFDVEKIVSEIDENNFSGMSLTDHDTVDGLNLAKDYCNKKDIDFIPGIEFGITYKKKEIHILGYFIDYNNKEISELIDKLKKDRKIRIKKIINRLKDLNLDVSFDELQKYAKKDIVSRSHIARLLVEKSYVNNIKEAFDIYLGQDGLAYIEKNNYNIKKVINIIKSAGGVSVLAHPGTIKDDDIVKEIINLGIDGIEIINSKHSLEDIVKYNDLCDNYKLIATAGSDCHGKVIDSKLLIGNYYLNYKNVEKIKKLHSIRLNK